jgi:hypothetical protein
LETAHNEGGSGSLFQITIDAVDALVYLILGVAGDGVKAPKVSYV